MPNVSNFGAQTDNAVVSGTVTDRQMTIPDVPPQGLMSVGPRVTPNYIKEPWSSLNSYVYFDVVRDVAGSSYIAIKPLVPAGTELTDEGYWFKWSDPDAQLNELEQIVKLYDGRISRNASAITAEEQRATAAEATKAPIDHASADTVYGVGNAVNYGHVKLADTGASDASASVAASPKYVSDVKTELTGKLGDVKTEFTGKLGDYYTKVEADGLFVTKPADNDQILGCVGDSILAGWSKEFTSGIDAWDTYLGKALNFKPANVFKAAIGGAGYVSGTTFESELTQLKNDIVDAGKSLNDVSMVVIGGGINDSTNDKKRDAVLSAATSAVNTACELFPNAQVHIFPMIMGWKGLRSQLLTLEDAIIEGAMLCSESNRNRVITHTGCWSWCYDGIDEGVSSDGVHLLQKGQQRVGTSMAVEINGGSAYRSGYSFEVGNAQGQKVATGHRRDSMVFFKLATNITTIKVGEKNAALGMHPRYCSENACITFSKPDESNTVIMFAEIEKGFFNSYNALSNTGCYGSVAYQIDYRSNIS